VCVWLFFFVLQSLQAQVDMSELQREITSLKTERDRFRDISVEAEKQSSIMVCADSLYLLRAEFTSMGVL